MQAMLMLLRRRRERRLRESKGAAPLRALV
jgi:hypothetical protein